MGNAGVARREARGHLISRVGKADGELVLGWKHVDPSSPERGVRHTLPQPSNQVAPGRANTNAPAATSAFDVSLSYRTPEQGRS